jgi:hypothetical protein
MANVKIQRGFTDIGNSGGTDTIGTAVSSLSNAFVINTNNRHTCGGPSNSSANMEADDMSGGCYLTGTNTIQFDRQSGSVSTGRFSWEVWEYTGAGSGSDEFIVRGRYQLTLTGESTTQAVTGITNIDNCVPFVNGIFSNSTADDGDNLTAIAWMSSGGTLNVKRGGGSTNTVQVYVTVVEFTGSNWAVKHGRSISAADSGTITLVDAADGTTAGGGDVTDWANAVIFHQQVANSSSNVDDAIADTSATFYPGGSTTQVAWAFHSDHNDAGSGASQFAHVLRHTGMTVTRFVDTQSAQGAMTVDVSSAGLAALDGAGVVVSRSSSGGGTAYGRGWVNARLTDANTVELWAHRSGNTISTRIQIVDIADPPVIGIDDQGDEQLDVGDVNELIDGFGFGAAQGTGKVELADSADYATATKVVQTIDSWSDTQVQYDPVFTGLSEGFLWLFITNDSGDTSTGYKVHYGVPSPSEVVLNLNPDHYWKFQNSYDDDAGSNPFNNVVSGTPGFVTTAPLACRGDTHAFEIDGTTADEHVEIADSSNINVGAQTRRYMGGWIRLDSIQKQLVVLYEEGAQINNVAFLIGFGNILMLQVADTGDDYAQAYSGFKLAADRWYNILYKFEASSYDAEVRLYIDSKLQPRTNGNPWTATDLDSHSGNVSLGHQPGENLEVGGTDIAFASPTKCHYAHWYTWHGLSLPQSDIDDLFVKCVNPAVDLAQDTAANMQTAFSAYDDTTRPDVPCAFQVAVPSDATDLTLHADNLIMEDRISIHFIWLGGSGKTLTLVNDGTSNIDVTKCKAPYGGTIVVQNPAILTITGLVTGCEVRLYDDDGGTGNFGTELAGIETLSGTTFQYSHNGMVNDIIIQILADGYVEIDQPHTLGSEDQTVAITLQQDTNK